MALRLLTVGSLPPEWGGAERGGVATFHASLLTGLLEREEEVEVVGALTPGTLEREAPVPVFERPADLPVGAFYERLLERVQPDVVLMNHVAHTIGVTHARLSGAPPAVGIVHSWHNLTFAEPAEQPRRRAVTQEALDGLAAMVVGSRHCLEEGGRLGLRLPQIAEVIHYPLQPLYLDPEIDVDLPARDGVLFLGSLIPRKNPEALIEAAARLPGLELAIAGEGELEEGLRGAVSRLSLAERVRLIPDFPPAEHLRRIRDLLLSAEVMCLPSRSESFGLAYIEALACGTPVVGFGPTVREIREAMGIEIGEPLEGGTPEEIAAAIGRVLATEWDRDCLRQAAIAAFDLDSAVDRYLALISRLNQGAAVEWAG